MRSGRWWIAALALALAGAAQAQADKPASAERKGGEAAPAKADGTKRGDPRAQRPATPERKAAQPGPRRGPSQGAAGEARNPAPQSR